MTKIVQYIGWVNEPGDLVERLIVGEEISQSQRKTFPIDPFITGNRSEQITGSIGFLDFRTVSTYEPVKGGKESPTRKDYLSSVLQYILPRRETSIPKVYTAIELAIIGVEPEYQQRGFATKLLTTLEQVAKERNIEVIVSAGPSSENKESLEFHKKACFIQEDRFFRVGTNNQQYFSFYKLL